MAVDLGFIRESADNAAWSATFLAHKAPLPKIQAEVMKSMQFRAGWWAEEMAKQW